MGTTACDSPSNGTLFGSVPLRAQRVRLSTIAGKYKISDGHGCRSFLQKFGKWRFGQHTITLTTTTTDDKRVAESGAGRIDLSALARGDTSTTREASEATRM